jgi:hypothetical protein
LYTLSTHFSSPCFVMVPFKVTSNIENACVALFGEKPHEIFEQQFLLPFIRNVLENLTMWNDH